MSTPAFPADRYGRRRSPARTPRWVVPVLVVLVIAVTSALAVVAYKRQASEVRAAVSSYVVSADSVRVTVDVTKPANEPATCVLRALDAAGAVVGQVSVTVPPVPRRATLTHTLSTSARPVTAEVVRCSLGGS